MEFLSLAGKSITHLEDVKLYKEVTTKIDLSKNNIEDASPLLQCHKLKWLNISKNALRSLIFVEKMKALSVLNLGNNHIADISAVANLKSLKALILNNNQITKAQSVENLTQLNTLVLSHNQLQTIDISCMTSLVKLQLSHNIFQSFPNIKFNQELKQLSLNSNKIKSVPADCIGENRLEQVDLGKNRIDKFKHIKALCQIESLCQVNLLDNPLHGHPEYLDKVLILFPKLKILDSHPIEKLQQRLRQTAQTSDDPEDSKAEIKKRKHKNTDPDPCESNHISPKDKKKKKKEKNTEPEDPIPTPELHISDSSRLADTSVEEKPEDVVEKKHKKRKIVKSFVTENSSADGVDAVKNKSQSGVVVIKDLRKKKKHSRETDNEEDIFSIFNSSVGQGNASAW